MNEAKRRGGNRTTVFEFGMRKSAAKRFDDRDSNLSAIREKRLVPFFSATVRCLLRRIAWA